MTDPSPVPAHLRTVTPRLVVDDGAAAIAFYRSAFGAEQIGDAFTGPAGELVHVELRIGDAVVMVTEDTGAGDASARAPSAVGGVVTAVMSTYWPDVDSVWERALAAGAQVVFPLRDQFYGDRSGRVRDPFGHQWMLSQRLETLSPAELAERGRAFFGNAD